nr:proline-rich extensin-like protein EPR1 [Oncorhynchus nerka]
MTLTPITLTPHHTHPPSHSPPITLTPNHTHPQSHSPPITLTPNHTHPQSHSPPIIMKSFTSLVLAHIKASMPGTLDPQFTKISTEGAIYIAVHTAVIYLDKRNTYRNTYSSNSIETPQPPTALPHASHPPYPSLQPPTALPPSLQPPTALPPSLQPPTALPPSLQPPTALPPSLQPPTALPPSLQPPALPPSLQAPSSLPHPSL